MYIVHFENGNAITHGPYFTISYDGNGAAIGQDWVAYKVQDEALCFDRISVPSRHYICAREQQ